jgi:hypothetical protein
MIGNVGFLEDISLRYYSLPIFILHIIIVHLVHNECFRFRGNIVLGFMYSDYTNYVDPHMITTIFLIYGLYYMIFLIDGFVFTVLVSCC